MKGEIVDEVLGMVRDTVMKDIHTRVQEQYREREEKERKKNNLLMYNIKESTGEQGKEEDEQQCEQLIAQTKTEQFKIVNVLRMGKVQQGKNRPLLVKLENSQMKYNILRNANNLNNTQQQQWIKKVSISKDKTIKEKEASKRLYEQLKQKRDDGEEGRYIRDGKLLQSKVRPA